MPWAYSHVYVCFSSTKFSKILLMKKTGNSIGSRRKLRNMCLSSTWPQAGSFELLEGGFFLIHLSINQTMLVTYLKPQCLPLVCGIKSFKAHHELAVPPSWPHLPGAPSPITQGVPATVTFSLCQDMSWVPPIPSTWTCPSFPLAGTLSQQMLAWFCPSLHSVLCSNAMFWERPFLNIFSQIPPSSCSISPYYFIFFIALITT